MLKFSVLLIIIFACTYCFAAHKELDRGSTPRRLDPPTANAGRIFLSPASMEPQHLYTPEGNDCVRWYTLPSISSEDDEILCGLTSSKQTTFS